MNVQQLKTDLRKLEAASVRDFTNIDHIRSTDGFCAGSVRAMAEIIVLMRDNATPRSLLRGLKRMNDRWGAHGIAPKQGMRPYFAKGAVRTIQNAIAVVEDHIAGRV